MEKKSLEEAVIFPTLQSVVAGALLYLALTANHILDSWRYALPGMCLVYLFCLSQVYRTKKPVRSQPSPVYAFPYPDEEPDQENMGTDSELSTETRELRFTIQMSSHQTLYVHFPSPLTPAHLKQFCRLVVDRGEYPTERVLCREGIFTNGREGTLNLLRETLMHRNFAVWKNNEPRQGWQLTPIGRKVMEKIADQLRQNT